ncbi:MAG: hypothetical protein L0Y44_00455 [Phycisphaerales bacterium]|nr:hypothetical protein [Phycisphaerales bacterium]MCI0675185.1 hypothetical protein [Phycisphaerales bacterium]
MSPRKTTVKQGNHSTTLGAGEPGQRRVSFNSALVVSLIALAAAGVFVCAAMATVLSSAFGAGTGQAKPADQLAKLVAQHQEKMQTYQARINGRSPFFDPPAPRPPTPPPPRPTEEPVRDPEPPPPAPKTYTGPNIIFAIGDTVRFKPFTVNDKPIDIRVGEQVGDLRVISTHLPWRVRVWYKGGEFDVPIFARGSEDKFLVAQAPPVTLVPFLVEVAAPKPVVETPTATGSAVAADESQDDDAKARQARGETFAEKRAKATQDARAASAARGSARPEPAASANRPAAKPASASNAGDETDEEDEDAAEEEEDEAQEGEDDDAAEPGQAGEAAGQGSPSAAPTSASPAQPRAPAGQRPQPRPQPRPR